MRLGYGHDGENALWVTYDLGGWIARISGQANAPFDGPEKVELSLDLTGDDDAVSDAIELAEHSAGITAGVLRSVPLNDARKVLRRLRAEVLAGRDEGAYDLPDRMVSLDDWIVFARAYARSAARNSQQPMVHLARATGLSVNTLNARLRRAQELGLLENTGDGWLVLAGQARLDEEK
jgi:hypothetical protein